MDYITSTANGRVKEVKKLRQKKYRDENGLYIAEGVNILKDMPESAEVISFFVTERARKSAEAFINGRGAEIFPVADPVMDAISDTDMPSGVLAVIKKPHSIPVSGNAVVLDGVSDPGNLGTIIRTASGAGYNDIITLNCADAFSPKTVRAAMGGVFRTNIVDADYDELPALLNGYQKICADMSGVSVFDYVPHGRIALFLGNEAHGLGEYSRSLADVTLSLPMANGQESLNVAVAAGIMMYVINSNAK